MSTTYNLSPEEKLQVFASKYIPLQTNTPSNDLDILRLKFDSSNFIDLPELQQKVLFEESSDPEEDISYIEATKKEVPEKEEIIEEKSNVIKEPNITQAHLNLGDNLLSGVTFFHAADGKEGLYNDRTDPNTVQHSVIERAKKYKPNSISKEIDELDLSEEDKQYLKLLQYMEGGGNYKVENKYGFKGLYQFGDSALKTIDMEKEDYMSNTINQHIAALKLKNYNLEKLGLRKYIGRTINGITLTLNKLAVALHALGLKSVKRYVESNGTQIPVDRNNFPVTAYITIF